MWLWSIYFYFEWWKNIKKLTEKCDIYGRKKSGTFFLDTVYTTKHWQWVPLWYIKPLIYLWYKQCHNAVICYATEHCIPSFATTRCSTVICRLYFFQHIHWMLLSVYYYYYYYCYYTTICNFVCSEIWQWIPRMSQNKMVLLDILQ